MYKKLLAGIAVVAMSFVLFSRPGQTATGLSCHTVVKANIPFEEVVECPAGEVVTGGGGKCYGFGGNWESFLTASFPSGKGWASRCENLKDGKKQISSETYAICCKP